MYLKVSNYVLLLLYLCLMEHSEPEGVGHRPGSEGKRNRVSHRILTRPRT